MRIFKNIPVYIHPSFWILALFIGYLYAQSLMQFGIWVVVVFISVLVHELGHALLARLWYKSVHIELGPLGGLTSRSGEPIGKLKEFVVVLMGPLAGFMLSGIAYLLLFITPRGEVAGYFLFSMMWANIFWSVVNLLPVHPLDGGKLMSIVLEGLFGLWGVRFSYLLSAIFALFFTAFFFIANSFLAGAIFLLCAYESFRAFQQERHLGTSQDSQKFLEEIEKANVDWRQNQPERAIQRLEVIVKHEPHGALFYSALAKLTDFLLSAGQTQKAYALLAPNKKKLTCDMMKQLQLAAFKLGLWQESLQAGTNVFLEEQDVASAVLNVFCLANLQQPEEAVHWLQAVKRLRPGELSYILASDDLDPIRNNPRFQKFVLEATGNGT